MSVKRLEPTRLNLTAAARAVKASAEAWLSTIDDRDTEVFGELSDELFWRQQLLLAEYVLAEPKGTKT